MAKEIRGKIDELMATFTAMGKNNPVLNDINELNKQMKDLMKNVAEKKWNETNEVYNVLQSAFQKYKDNIKIMSKNDKVLKKTMSKLKNLYKDEISKKIKEAEALKITNDAFDLARNTFKSYRDSLEVMKKQWAITVDGFREIKDSLKSKKKSEKKSATPKAAKKNKTQPQVKKDQTGSLKRV